MTLKEILRLKTAWEESGRRCSGVMLTPEQARELRWELHQLYGQDPGEWLTTLYGLEVLSITAERFELVE